MYGILYKLWFVVHVIWVTLCHVMGKKECQMHMSIVHSHIIEDVVKARMS